MLLSLLVATADARPDLPFRLFKKQLDFPSFAEIGTANWNNQGENKKHSVSTEVFTISATDDDTIESFVIFPAVLADLPLEEQRKQWFELPSQSPLRKAGLHSWISIAEGLRFQGDSRVVDCRAIHGETQDTGIRIKFACSQKKLSATSLAEVGEGAYYYSWRSVAPETAPYGWPAVSGGSGSWNWPYYTITPSGYYGCAALTSSGSCLGQIYNYPFASTALGYLQTAYPGPMAGAYVPGYANSVQV